MSERNDEEDREAAEDNMHVEHAEWRYDDLERRLCGAKQERDTWRQHCRVEEKWVEA